MLLVPRRGQRLRREESDRLDGSRALLQLTAHLLVFILHLDRDCGARILKRSFKVLRRDLGRCGRGLFGCGGRCGLGLARRALLGRGLGGFDLGFGCGDGFDRFLGDGFDGCGRFGRCCGFGLFGVLFGLMAPTFTGLMLATPKSYIMVLGGLALFMLGLGMGAPLILVGGVLGGAVDNANLPAAMEVDYVRVYSKN